MRVLSLNLIILLTTLSSYAQDKIWAGTIKTKSNLPVEFANIIISDTALPGKTLAFTSSGKNGHFDLHLPAATKYIAINVTAIGFTELNVKLSLDTLKSITIYMDTSAKTLEEVVVKAQHVNDTLNVGMDSMRLTKNATLRDILDKTEGVMVSKEGGISYHGKQINKVMINNKEVFVNQNKIALDNLNYEIMDTLQIINNYKDQFSIDFNKIQDPVINIKTKSAFRSVIKTQIDAGYGYNNVYGIKAKAFYFSETLNAFATTHTNNIGQKDLSQRDVLSPLNDRSSEVLKNNLMPFFLEDNQMKKNIASNSSLTLRWQEAKSKTGLVLLHGYINTQKQTGITTTLADTLLRISNTNETKKGNFYQATLNYNKIIGKRSVLQNTTNAFRIDRKLQTNNVDTQFIPSIVNLKEQTGDRSSSWWVSNNAKYTNLLTPRTVLELNLHYFFERDLKDLDTKLDSTRHLEINQTTVYRKQSLNAFPNLKFKLKKGVNLNAGLSFLQNHENAQLAADYRWKPQSINTRNITVIESPFSLLGSIRRLDYNIGLSPSYIASPKTNSQTFLKTAGSLVYNFEPQNNLILAFDRSYRFFDLNSLFDTVVQTYNYRIATPDRYKDDFTKKNEISVSWFNSNASKSKMYYATYTYTVNHHFLQTLFDSVSNNIFYYSNKIFDRFTTQSINAGGRKGFYFSPVYHRIDIGSGIRFTSNNYQTLVDKQLSSVHTISWQPVITWGFTPRNSIIRAITGKEQWDRTSFYVNNQNVNQQTVLTNSLEIESIMKKISWKIEYLHLFYYLPNQQFNVPDCNLTCRYEISEKLTCSLIGRSLLTLFKWNNYNFVNTITNGNTLNRITTNNNLGYLMASLSLKF